MALFQKNQANQHMQNQLSNQPPRQIEKSQSDQPIVGLRVWRVIDDKGLPKLRSVFKETVWPYRKALERDVLNDMGIHAVRPGVRASALDPLARIVGTGAMDVLSLFASYEADVAGEVYLWGHVDEHEWGWLADFAYPKKLYPHADLDPVIAMQLEDEYGVPVEYRREFTKVKKPSKEEMQLAAVHQQNQMAIQQIQYYQQMQQAQAKALQGSPGGLMGQAMNVMNVFGKIP